MQSFQTLCAYVQSLSCVWLFASPWATACQAPLSMKFSRQEYWSGLPFPSPGYLLNPGIEPWSPLLQADFYPLSHLGRKIILSCKLLFKSIINNKPCWTSDFQLFSLDLQALQAYGVISKLSLVNKYFAIAWHNSPAF